MLFLGHACFAEGAFWVVLEHVVEVEVLLELGIGDLIIAHHLVEDFGWVGS